MKKFLSTVLVLGILGGGGYLVYKRFFAPKQVRACEKLAKLCGQHSKESSAQCEQKMADLEKAVGKPAMDKAVSCLDEATTCARGVGCLVGSGVNAIGNALGDFLEGVRRSVGK
jgi:hypothetical protein